MVYFDTNVLIYAFCKNVDNTSQQDISVTLFDKGINKQDIEDNLQFLAHFLKDSDVKISHRMLDMLSKKGLYASSFDVYHLAFSEYHDATLYTFDKGFKKLNDIAQVKIEIL